MRTPLTTQNLKHEERLRLLRSTRKIDSLFGHTPHLVDVIGPDFEAPRPMNQRRIRRRAAPPVEWDEPPLPTSTEVSAHARPVLYIRLPEPCDTPDPAPEPISAVVRSPSPTLTVALKLRPIVRTRKEEDALKRRKMAKLVRTLGAHVPPELVFPAVESDRRVRRLSTRTILSDVVHDGKRRRAADSSAGSISHGWVWVGRPEEIPSDVHIRETGAEAYQRRIRASLSGEQTEAEDEGLTMIGGSITALTADALARSGFGVPVSGTDLTELRMEEMLRRRGDGWIGEWVGRVETMDDVVQQLRTLRVK
ncbi:unnamed protein product [Mycena citricolor]|uniref:Uncharacterized protein n=1 Tax=Mycena citricolor TaxID=2018698 RepID=A0AAD2JYM9_9AGAR|nr:unnamed protein product [Mycena citricolor]